MEYWTDDICLGDALNLANNLGFKIHPDRIAKRNLIIDLFQLLISYTPGGVQYIDDLVLRTKPVYRQAKQFYDVCQQAINIHREAVRATTIAVCNKDMAECTL